MKLKKCLIFIDTWLSFYFIFLNPDLLILENKKYEETRIVI